MGLLFEFSDEDNLKALDGMLLQLRTERAVARDTPATFYSGRSVREIEAEIEDVEYRRKLLLEKMTVVTSKISERSVNLTNPQFHFGVGDNVGKNKTEVRESNKGFLYEHRYPAMLIIICLILVIFFGWNYQSEISLFGFGKIVPPNNNNQPSVSKLADISQIPTSSPLRPLEPLETGKKISELPNGVYFFAAPTGIAYEIGDHEIGLLKATNRRLQDFSFEIQKIDKRYYLIGFLSDETYSRLGSINSKNIINAVIFPNRWEGAKNSIAIPFDKILSIQDRRIDLDMVTQMYVLDISFDEVKEHPEIHSN